VKMRLELPVTAVPFGVSRPLTRGVFFSPNG
jgi:hypothetical protein